MTLKTSLAAASLLSLSVLSISVLSGCQNFDTQGLMSAGTQALQVATISDSDVKTLSDKSCAEMDAQAKLAPANSPYTTRLNKIADSLGYSVNGTALNYKVYLTSEVNAWAMANGCVRVYSGLMDKMTDNEIQGVVGHEIGHVALGHSKHAMQIAYSAEIARGAIASAAGGVIASLTQSQLGDIAEQFVNAQFSQKQELAADNYSFDMLSKKGISPAGLATAFDKLGGGEATLLSSHPSSSARAQNIRSKLAAQ
ncbi:M48 family metallopeptidase [Utexia brackfieldae]|uniref:metalloprotease LoiP n=1 Tax=Utexia brackfieldae TaxID=3074108 RepID=UPI00370DA98F